MVKSIENLTEDLRYLILLAGITADASGVQETDRSRKGECMKKLFMTWLK
jgi:hypothetical protein